MKRRPFYELQRGNRARKPTWRWDRANNLVNSGRYFSKKRDDVATGITVAYLRDMARFYTELRLRRVKNRYEHVDRARQLWGAFDGRRLEVETRILARQNDVEIGLEMDLPAATIQAYRDIFFHVDDRIDASSYIVFKVIGVHSWLPSHPLTLMQSSAYFHGPAVIEPWFQFLRGDHKLTDLTSEVGRLMATIDLFVATHTLPDNAETHRSLVKLAPILLSYGSNSAKSVSAAAAFSKLASRVTADLGFSCSALAPFSYAPAHRNQVGRSDSARMWKDSKAA